MESFSLILGDHVLDVGTGFGNMVSLLLESDKYRVTSIDPEAWTFQELEKKYEADIRNGRLELLRSRIEEVPFENRKFDTAISLASLHHLPDPALGLREMERVSRKRVIAADWNEMSGGKYNPHSPEDLLQARNRAIDFGKRNGYEIREYEYWYLMWKDLS